MFWAYLLAAVFGVLGFGAACLFFGHAKRNECKTCSLFQEYWEKECRKNFNLN
jgi:hypothetical protein